MTPLYNLQAPKGGTMNKEVAKKWVDALRSGEYEQARRKLRKDDGYCCLGVLCEVYHKEYIAIAEWLEYRIPDATIFYGGDSSGICAEPFDREERARIFRHFATVGHRPYTGGFANAGSMFGIASKPPVVCGFCDYAMTECGGGGHFVTTFFRCDGCGKQAIRDNKTGGVVEVPRGKDFFDMSKPVP